jgi:hypothetical protein
VDILGGRFENQTKQRPYTFLGYRRSFLLGRIKQLPYKTFTKIPLLNEEDRLPQIQTTYIKEDYIHYLESLGENADYLKKKG